MGDEQARKDDRVYLPDSVFSGEDEQYLLTPRKEKQARPPRDPQAWKQRPDAVPLPPGADEDEAAQYYPAPARPVGELRRTLTEWFFIGLGIFFLVGLIVATLLQVGDVFRQ